MDRYSSVQNDCALNDRDINSRFDCEVECCSIASDETYTTSTLCLNSDVEVMNCSPQPGSVLIIEVGDLTLKGSSILLVVLTLSVIFNMLILPEKYSYLYIGLYF